jgi:hypothetical protein
MKEQEAMADSLILEHSSVAPSKVCNSYARKMQSLSAMFSRDITVFVV